MMSSEKARLCTGTGLLYRSGLKESTIYAHCCVCGIWVGAGQQKRGPLLKQVGGRTDQLLFRGCWFVHLLQDKRKSPRLDGIPEVCSQLSNSAWGPTHNNSDQEASYPLCSVLKRKKKISNEHRALPRAGVGVRPLEVEKAGSGKYCPVVNTLGWSGFGARL